MTNEERDLITRFIQRVGGVQGAGISAPGQPAAPLPPIDPEADRLIGELFAQYPEARYRIAQMAFVQEHALAEASNRIQRLEWEVQQAQAQAQQQQQPGASPWGQQQQPQQGSRGFFGSLFGGPPRQAPPQQYAPPQQQYAPQPPPPPQYAPGYSPGMFAPRGSGFLGSALTTAAGVAGGLVAGNALMNLFSGHGGFGSGSAGGFIPGAAAASPWGAPGGADPYDQGGAGKSEPDSSGWTTADPGQPAPDSSGWSDPGQDNQPAPDDSGWTDPASDAGSDSFDTGTDSSDWT